MRFLLATHVLRGYPPADEAAPDPERRCRLFAWARRQGFDGIEIGNWWLDVCNLPGETVRAVAHEIRVHGLDPAGFNLLRRNVTHPTVKDANRRAVLTAIERAGEIGAGFVSLSLSISSGAFGLAEDQARGLAFSPGGSRSAEPGELEEAAAFLHLAADRAASLGVELALELHHCSLADTSTSLLRLIELADHWNLRPNPDLVNLYWAYGEPEEEWTEALLRLAGRNRVWHVKNTQRIWLPEIGRARFLQVPLDQGDVDYRWAMGHMLRAGFDGDISIEGAGPGDFLALAARNLAYLKALLADHEAEDGLLVQ